LGNVLRISTRGNLDPAPIAQHLLAPHGITLTRIRPARVSVEDAFVALVREDERRGDKAPKVSS
jgi:hypothetical protein